MVKVNETTLSPRSPASASEENQVYVSHLCLHNFHPIFCKFNLETVKLVLHYSSIVNLKKQDILYSSNLDLNHVYIILFGKLRLYECDSRSKIGNVINLGWTLGEETLFGNLKSFKTRKEELCKSVTDSCLLAISKDNLKIIKSALNDQQLSEEFVKLEIVLRGNYLIKKKWFE